MKWLIVDKISKPISQWFPEKTVYFRCAHKTLKDSFSISSNRNIDPPALLPFMWCHYFLSPRSYNDKSGEIKPPSHYCDNRKSCRRGKMMKASEKFGFAFCLRLSDEIHRHIKSSLARVEAKAIASPVTENTIFLIDFARRESQMCSQAWFMLISIWILEDFLVPSFQPCHKCNKNLAPQYFASPPHNTQTANKSQRLPQLLLVSLSRVKRYYEWFAIRIGAGKGILRHDSRDPGMLVRFISVPFGS